MRHQLTQTFDSEHSPMLVCSICGAIFAARTPVDLVEASVCIGALPDHLVDMVYRAENFLALLNGAFRPKPYEDCETKGRHLLEAWEKGETK